MMKSYCHNEPDKSASSCIGLSFDKFLLARTYWIYFFLLIFLALPVHNTLRLSFGYFSFDKFALHLQVVHLPFSAHSSIVLLDDSAEALQMKHFGYLVSVSSKYGARVDLLVVFTRVDCVVLRVVGFVVFGFGRVLRFSSFITSLGGFKVFI